MEGTMVKIRSDVITEEALVITCFPSVGMVSSVVGHFLIDNLELEFVGETHGCLLVIEFRLNFQ